ncbi:MULTISPECIES: hypothetical protein [Microbacterium]|uniref:hypothetical protein n=1 Tax=Microbacterium TaxID=33882 RepID=UPI00217F0A53|nr:MULTISPECIES: hypothetical protein [Microbacterium]UWF77641.1 hypothetical protein JSY13_00670 [Microbacterium neungamense]WCM55810.1 hypothetical protein JRG78_00680 [Microbacterium sp. EF45047]
MYEHPYLTHRINVLETERLEAELERRRRILEQPERLIPRERWTTRLRGFFRGRTAGAVAPVAPVADGRADVSTDAAGAAVSVTDAAGAGAVAPAADAEASGRSAAPAAAAGASVPDADRPGHQDAAAEPALCSSAA